MVLLTDAIHELIWVDALSTEHVLLIKELAFYLHELVLLITEIAYLTV